MRQTRYQAIAEAIRLRLAEGEFDGGRLLPSEAALSEEYGASRVTVRRSLELLREEGLVASRQGFGWFAAGDPVRQSLAQLGTIEDQLTAEGLSSERRILDFRFVTSPPRVQDQLGDAARTVLRVRRLNLANGSPFALVTVWCPEAIGAALSRASLARASFYDLLGVELGGATQSIGAAAASADEAALLGIAPGSPVLRCERLTRSAAGAPVLFSEHTFPAEVTEFVVDLPAAEASMSPAGLRLVDEPG